MGPPGSRTASAWHCLLEVRTVPRLASPRRRVSQQQLQPCQEHLFPDTLLLIPAPVLCFSPLKSFLVTLGSGTPGRRCGRGEKSLANPLLFSFPDGLVWKFFRVSLSAES